GVKVGMYEIEAGVRRRYRRRQRTEVARVPLDRQEVDGPGADPIDEILEAAAVAFDTVGLEITSPCVGVSVERSGDGGQVEDPALLRVPDTEIGRSRIDGDEKGHIGAGRQEAIELHRPRRRVRRVVDDLAVQLPVDWRGPRGPRREQEKEDGR